MKLRKLREEASKTCKDLYLNELARITGTGGNLSAESVERDYLVVTPSQVRYDDIQAKDMIVTNPEGEIIDSKPNLEPTSELPMHTIIQRKFPEASAVIHTHSKYANILASLGVNIPAMHTEFAAFIGQEVPVIDYETPGSERMAREIANSLEKIPAVVMRNHGPIAIGKDLSDAMNRSIALEDSAELYYKSKCLGQPSTITKSECNKIKKG